MPSTLEKITNALNEIKHLNKGAEKGAALWQADHDILIKLESWVKKDLARRLKELEDRESELIKKDLARRVKDLEDRENVRAKVKAAAVTQSGLRTWQVWLLLVGMIPGTVALIITILKWISESPVPSP